MDQGILIKKYFFQRFVRSTMVILFDLFGSCLTILLSLSIGAYYEILNFHHSGKVEVLNRFHIQLSHDPATYFVVFALIVLGKVLFHFLGKYYSALLALDFTSNLQKKLFRHQLKISLGEFNKKPQGSYLLRYSGDMSSIRQYITKGIFRFISDCLFVIISLFILWSMHAKTTIILIGALALGFLLIHLLNKRLRVIQSKRRNMRSANLSFVNEGFKSFSTIKIFNREYATIKKFNNKTDKLSEVSRSYLLLSSINNAIIPGILFLTLLFIFIIHFQSVNSLPDNLNDTGGFTSYIILIILMFPTYRRSMEVSSIWQSGNIALGKINRILNLSLDDIIKNKKDYQPGEGKIELQHLSFNYEGGEPLFSNLNAQFGRGKINYIHGQYKSTLFKLIIGLYHQSGGKILLDGEDLHECTKKSVRRNIAVISEDFPLYGNSILKCLVVVDNKECREKVFKLLNQLNFYNDRNLTNYDLDQQIGRNGSFLSQSQYKKMLIARALLSGKHIILIDGIVEVFDPETQAEIYKIFEAIKYTHTILIAVNSPEQWINFKVMAS